MFSSKPRRGCVFLDGCERKLSDLSDNDIDQTLEQENQTFQNMLVGIDFSHIVTFGWRRTLPHSPK